MSTSTVNNFGWYRDLPDHRDYSPDHKKVKRLLRQLKLRKTSQQALPKRVNWQEYCLAVQDQQDLPTSTAHATVGLIQYFERRSSGRATWPSRLFVYNIARRLLHTNQDGASIRAALKGTARFGIPPESYWPYDHGKLDENPDAFAHGFSDEYRELSYYRVDGLGRPRKETLERIKAHLAAGFVFIFGFRVCSAVTSEAEIYFPTLLDDMSSGQAALAVGYDDKIRIRSDKGAFRIRNSWGSGWGEEGYGWLPYSYVTQGIAADFWSVAKPEWLASGEFTRPL